MHETPTISIVCLVTILSILLALRLFLSNRRLRSRFAPVVDIDAELATVKRDLERAKNGRQEFIEENGRQRTKLTEEYDQARSTYERLKKEVSLGEENLEDNSL